MKIHSLRDMSQEELKQKRHELMEELFNLNMRRSLKELDNPLRLRTIHRDIARIETIFAEDKLGVRKIVDSPVSILDRPDDKGKKVKTEKEGE